MKDLTQDILIEKIKSVEPDGVPVNLTFKLNFEEPVRTGSKLRELPLNTASVEAYRYGREHKPKSNGFYIGGLRAIEKTGLAIISAQYVKSFK